MNKPLQFAEGQMWEEGPWELRFNYQCEGKPSRGITPCRHSVVLGPAEPKYRSDGSQYNADEIAWTVPRIVIAENEGGYNSTGVCADCIFEAVAALRDKEE